MNKYTRYLIGIDPGPERSGGVVFGLEELQPIDKPTILWTSTGTVPDDTKKKGTKVVHNQDNNAIFSDIMDFLIEGDPYLDIAQITFMIEKPEFRMAIMNKDTMETIHWTGRFAEKCSKSMTDRHPWRHGYMITPSSVRLLIFGKRSADAVEIKQRMVEFFGANVIKGLHAHVLSAARLYMAYWIWDKQMRNSNTTKKRQEEMLQLMEVIR